MDASEKGTWVGLPDSRTRSKDPLPRPVTQMPVSCCEWQECDEQAVEIRDTPWGDLPVCYEHARTPLDR